LVATAGTSAVGVLPKWQVSHFVELGTCELAPGAPVGGITTILLTPKKLEPVMLGPWQVSQPLVIPLWPNAELLNLALFCTGSVKLEFGPTWQASQLVLPNGMWFDGGAAMLKLIDGMA
jgi:hypothetical protein